MNEDKRVFLPAEVGREHPVDGVEIPVDRRVHINTVPGEVEIATAAELQREIDIYGRLREPEANREKPPPPGALAFGDWYSATYPTRFFFRPDVARTIARAQKLLPWRTFANTYVNHPPVYGHTYERVSVDFWGGGLNSAGRYVGYRGKPIGAELGWKVFNALFNDEFLPNIYWIIWAGRMWTRGYGWGPAPWGPAGSDAGHHYHVHCTYVL